MIYLFVLGRDHELSKLEIESLLENKGINFRILDESREVLSLECGGLDPNIIDEFGGVIKIAKVISNTNRIDEIEANLDNSDLYNGKSNKIQYFITPFNTDLLSFVEDYLKDYFKTIKVKALYRRDCDPSKLIKRNIIENGFDIVIFKNLIGKTIAAYNPLELKKRDVGRPQVDYKRVISIRLAKILINISKVKKNEILLDPFSGSGTILQEALLKEINVIGLDNDSESVKQAEENIKWLVKNYNIKNKFQILKLDCRKLREKIKDNSIDGVVTEPYMGPFIKKLPSIPEARKLVSELSFLYMDLLNNLKHVVRIGKRIVIVMPKFRTRENKILSIDFRGIAESNGFDLAANPINYGYKDSKLLREIYVLERQ